MVRKHEFTSQMNVVVLLNIQSMENEYDKVIKRDIIEFGNKVSATLLNDSLNNGVPFRFGSNAPAGFPEKCCSAKLVREPPGQIDGIACPPRIVNLGISTYTSTK